MTLECNILESGEMAPQAIMDKDASLLQNLSPDASPLLHLYEWDVPCLTYGYFTSPEDHLYLDILKENNIHMAKRVTGGGIIFHLTDFAFSLLIPSSHPSLSNNTLENYAFVNGLIADAIKDLIKVEFFHAPCCQKKKKPSFCMAEPTPFDLLIQGKKVGGAAQRRTKQGLLHHASLSLLHPPFPLLEKLLKKPEDLEAMKSNSAYLFPFESDLTLCMKTIKTVLKNKLGD